MSFILDALKKSQSSRQRQSAPGIVTAEMAPGKAPPHNWLAIVVFIVALNLLAIAALAWYLTQDRVTEEAPQNAIVKQGATPPVVSADRPGMATESEPGNANEAPSRVRGEVRPLSAEVRDSGSSSPPQVVASVPEPIVAASAEASELKPTPSESAGFLPTLAELKLDRRIELSPLHIDVHVYNENPQRRFVLINARKYKEGERLTEGPLLEEIRRDGLVMYYRDQRFLVPRE